MSKEIKEKLVPKLRFREFVNNSNWKKSLLGELIDIKGRIGYRGYTTADIVKKGQGAITLSPSNFDESGSLNFEKCTYISWNKYEESPEIQLEEGQTVLVKTASVGKTAYVQNLPEKATVNPQIVVLKPNKIQNRFLAYAISHQNIQSQIRNCVGAGAIPNLSQESISNFEVLLPPDREQKEQQKIADCLSSLDDLVTAENQKLEALKEHKKGLMQQLFPAEGETVPKLRFEEFRDSEDWHLRKLDEMAIVARGKSKHRPRDADFLYGGVYPFIQTGDVRKAELYLTDFTQTYSEAGLKQSKLWEVDTLCITIAANIAETAILKIKACFPDSIIGVIPKANMTNVLFLKYLFDNFKMQIQRQSQGMAQDNLNQEKLLNIDFIFPHCLEQQKIADCLSSLDKVIAAQSEKIEALKEHKKGLMQGLFPSNEN